MTEPIPSSGSPSPSRHNAQPAREGGAAPSYAAPANENAVLLAVEAKNAQAVQLQLFDIGSNESPKKARDQKARWHESYLRKYADPGYRARQRERSRRSGELNPGRNAAWKRMDRKRNPEKYAEQEARARARFAGAFVERVYRRRVFERDGWICGICFEPVDRTARVPDHRAATLDHIIPLARGGEHSYRNTQCAHFACNAAKGDRDPTVASLILGQRVFPRAIEIVLEAFVRDMLGREAS